MYNAQLNSALLIVVFFSLIDASLINDGIFRPRIQSRVIGGEATTIDKVGGFVVALLYHGVFTCAGSLIHEQIVISAQHCILSRTDMSEWTAVGGISKLHEKGPSVEIESLMKPIAFREEDLHMDVVVLKLRKPLIGPKIKTIKLCTQKWQKDDLMTLTGWGLIDPSASAPHQTLRSVQVPIIAKRICRDVYAVAINMTDSMFCAGVLKKKDACTYDSGGPLVFHGELCGIVSFGIGCASAKFPGVYTNIHYVKPFIQNAITTLMKSH